MAMKITHEEETGYATVKGDCGATGMIFLAGIRCNRKACMRRARKVRAVCYTGEMVIKHFAGMCDLHFQEWLSDGYNLDACSKTCGFDHYTVLYLNEFPLLYRD